MTIVELPGKLPGWVDLHVDKELVAKSWCEEYSFAARFNFWVVKVQADWKTQSFIYADAIRRK